MHTQPSYRPILCVWPLGLCAVTVWKVRLHLWYGLVNLVHQKILRCGNGNEFKGEALCIVESYGITLIYGHPQHPQTQGLIEIANAVLKQKIRIAKAKTGVNRWRQFYLWQF